MPAGRNPALSLVVLIVLCGTMASIVFHYVMAAYVHARYPYTTFLFSPKDRFMDFFNVYRHAQEFRPGVSENMVYSPLMHLVMSAATLVPSWVAFGLLVGAFLVVLVLLLWRWTTATLRADPLVRALHVAILTLLAYPALFVIDRGNLEMLVFILLAAFFWLYYARRSPWAWLPLGLAIAAKYYWVALLVLLLLDREWRQACWCVVTTVVSSATAALAVSLVSGYSLVRVATSWVATLGGHVDSTGILGLASHNHSLWSWVICFTRWTDYAYTWLPDRRIYLLAALVVVLLVVRRLMRGDLADWQKATALTACALVLPYESMDYTLIHVLLPLSLFVAATRTGVRNAAVACLFGILLVPLDYHYLRFWGAVSWVSVSSLAYPLALLSLIVLVLKKQPGGDSADVPPAVVDEAQGTA